MTTHTGQRRELLTGNHAASYGAVLAGNANGGMVISAYPITPQTDIVKRLSDLVADGTLANSRYIPVESEHSAMAVVLASSLAGARAFTATSSQGLLLMGELVWWAAASRAPVVLANVNRALAPGWSIWTDQQDSLSMRDTGWIQYYCADNQEVLDSVLLGYRIGEALRLPVMVVLDAFVLSHTAEEVLIPDTADVEAFLPRYRPEVLLDPATPRIFGGLTSPDVYPSFRRKMDRALARLPELESAAQTEFAERFGREYSEITEYRTEDAEIVLVTSATVARTARVAVDRARESGLPAGVVRVRRFRPFPGASLRRVLSRARRVAVLDRNVSLGSEGIFATELKGALYGSSVTPEIHAFIAGLGGQDITPGVLEEIFKRVAVAERPPAEPVWVGVLPEGGTKPARDELSLAELKGLQTR
ncbi:MAG: pyruvate ferredoxin oxidoreductase [Acidobacteriota bacterium]|nr:pyruvate ferredoxin oxidoreductase [Acidobacteriota bacterium]